MSVDAQESNGSVSNEQPVYRVLAEHQCAEPWELQDVLCKLLPWADTFNGEFKLEVPNVSLCVDWLSRNRYGHFRPGHNGFGLRNEIAINRRSLGEREFWQVLGTLLHELLHAHQEAHGRPGKGNYHNVAFRKKAQEYGLIVDARGYTQYAPESLFLDLLAKHWVQVPSIPSPVVKLRGSSKLKKWTCGCTNVRVAVAEFHAKCLKCGNLFVQEA